MPIINKGIFTTGSAYLRQVGNDWPTAQVVYTADILESSSNLYFTTARVASNVATLMKSFQGSGLTIDAANGQININTGASSIPELANVANTVISLAGHTTTEINEGSNLYFTNARVFSAIAGGSSSLYVGNTTASTSKTTGALRVAGGVGISNDLTVGNSISVDGGAYGNVVTTQFASVWGQGAGPNPYSIMQVRSSDNVSGIGMQAYTGQGVLYGNTTITFALATIRDRDVPSSLIPRAFLDSTGLTVLGNVNASTVQANIWLGIYTANVIETDGNLYFTNARVLSALSNATIQGNLYITQGNLYVTDSIFANNLILRGINATSNILSGGTVTASGFTGNTLTVDVVTSNTWNGLYTANVIETAGNLYFTDYRAIVALAPWLTTGNVIQTTQQYFTNARVLVAVTPLLTTANVTESASNLYFTNSRVVSALVAGDNITIEANGRISTASSASGVILSDSIRIISTGNATYGMGVSVSDPKKILVTIEGILQIPIVDYNVSGTDITFDTYTPIGANIEIKTFGTETLSLSTTAAIQSKVDNFIANSAITAYTLTLTPPSKDYISVVLNGNTLASTAYTLTTNIVTLAFAPPTGANLDIRTIAGRSGSVFNTRKYTGNGISNTFVISAGFNNDTILVFENGISQFPVTDYNVVNENLVFVTPPAANVAIQIRELGVPVAVTAANALPAIRGYDQITGNLLPASPSKNLGNATTYWNTVYANSLYVGTTYTPSTSSSTGTPGQITWDSGWIYVCIATNTWKRANITTW